VARHVREVRRRELRLEAAPAPSREELQETQDYVYARVVKWLARRGLVCEAENPRRLCVREGLASLCP
jgi:hypothetical protein